MDMFAAHPETFEPGDQSFPLDVNTEYWRIINEVARVHLAPEEAASGHADLHRQPWLNRQGRAP
jgi:hypothetical protein